MASYTATIAKEATLTSTTVDTVTVTPGITGALAVTVYNQHASNYLYVTWSEGGTAATPTAGGDDCVPVAPASATTIRLPNRLSSSGGVQAIAVKIIGNGNKYNVVVLPA